MRLSDVRYQVRAMRTIQQAIRAERLAHAYVFHGPGGVGKEMFARGLAALLLCSQSEDSAVDAEEVGAVGVNSVRRGCGNCVECRLVAAGTHPDYHLIHRLLHREHPDADVRRRKGVDLGVDVVRCFVIDRVGFRPSRGRAKVFILRDADTMSDQAQNALLKTLEEPPGSTVLILLVENLSALLPTTLSRSQIVRFDPLPNSFIEERLRNLRPGLSSELLRWYARVGDGSLGLALRFADTDLHSLNQAIVGDLQSLIASTVPAKGTGRRNRVHPDVVAKSWVEQAASVGEKLKDPDSEITDAEASRRGLSVILRLAADGCADMLRHVVGENSRSGSDEFDSKGAAIDAETLATAIERIGQTERQLDLNAHVQLCVDALLNDLARALGPKQKQTARATV
ncbi:MAG: DNA polymerase III subunit [Planctomycetota bacterium]